MRLSTSETGAQRVVLGEASMRFVHTAAVAACLLLRLGSTGLKIQNGPAAGNGVGHHTAQLVWNCAPIQQAMSYERNKLSELNLVEQEWCSESRIDCR